MFHIVLVEPEIPANTGNIARLCAATNSILHLIRPLGFRLDDAAMRRAGMDYLDIATIREHASLAECLPAETSVKEGLSDASSVYYLSTKAARPYWEAKFLTGDYLVFGRETKGLPEKLLQSNRKRSLTIPMSEKRARSLNLATSVGIVLYEAIRQQAACGL